jgi:hypothetical protein
MYMYRRGMWREHCLKKWLRPRFSVDLIKGLQGCVQKSYPGAPRSPCAVRKLPVMQTWSSVMRSELFG